MEGFKDKINSRMYRRFKKWGTKRVDHDVTLTKIYAKHNGVCQSCGKRTKRTHTPTDDTATIEHIVPLSRGGDHTWDNVTLYCHPCNMANSPIRRDNSKYYKTCAVVMWASLTAAITATGLLIYTIYVLNRTVGGA